uniref:Uncharacterized protein n=1 Tax=Panagrolaimus sp. PS1159 TaxID=55785 RepID=A0AC35EUJ2_9BILA
MYAAGLSLHSKVTISNFPNISQKQFFYEDYIIVSEGIFNSLPYAYQSALVKLSKLVTNATTLEARRELFESFSKKFTLHVEILKVWKDLEIQAIHPDDIQALEERETYINIKATQNLYDDKFLNYSFSKSFQFPVLNKVLTSYNFNGNFEIDVYNFLEVNEGIKLSLTFPNQHLQAFWKYYLKHSLSPIHPMLEFKYRQAQIIYEKICKVYHNKRQWIRFMKETNDHEFVVQNIEAALGKNPFNKEIWKEYIEYLRKIDPKEMLNVYSRCCHFFVDDWEIRENYLKEIKRIEKKYEENVQKWEIDYNNLNSDFPVRIPREFVIDHVMNGIKESTTKAIFDPFKKYLSKRRKSRAKKILTMPETEEEIFSIQDPKNPAFKLPLLDYIAKNANSKLILKLYSISKWFYIRNYCFLVSGGNVEDISFENVNVTKKNGNPVTVDYLIEKLPKIKTLKFGPGTVIDRFSSGRLGDIKLKTLVEHFEIHNLDEFFEVFGFSDFIKNNTTPTTRFFLYFKEGTDATVKLDFRKNLFFLTESFIPRFTTPYLNIS